MKSISKRQFEFAMICLQDATAQSDDMNVRQGGTRLALLTQTLVTEDLWNKAATNEVAAMVPTTDKVANDLRDIGTDSETKGFFEAKVEVDADVAEANKPERIPAPDYTSGTDPNLASAIKFPADIPPTRKEEATTEPAAIKHAFTLDPSRDVLFLKVTEPSQSGKAQMGRIAQYVQEELAKVGLGELKLVVLPAGIDIGGKLSIGLSCGELRSEKIEVNLVGDITDPKPTFKIEE